MTTTTVAPPAPTAPHDELRAPSLLSRAEAIGQLATMTPGAKSQLLAFRVAHPDLRIFRVRKLAQAVYTGTLAGQPEMVRRAGFALLHGMDAAPCPRCVRAPGRRVPLDLIARVGECVDATHLAPTAAAAVA